MGKYRRPRINFVLDEDIRDDLTVWAKEEGRTMSNLVERIVTAAVQGKRNSHPNQNPLIQQDRAEKGGTSKQIDRCLVFKTVTNLVEPEPSEPENIHSATDPEKCRDMGRKYRWRLKRMEQTNDRILKVNCVFYGEQTSFEDSRFGDTDDE